MDEMGHKMQDKRDVGDSRDLFWEADLDDIERSFLHGRRIIDLEVKTDDRVPPQGNVLLRRVTRLQSYGKVT